MMSAIIPISPADVPEHPVLHRTLLYGTGMVLLGLLVLGWLQWSNSLYSWHDIKFNTGPTIVVFVLIYGTLSLKEVRPDEIGGAFFYGRALVRFESGLQLLPPGLMQMKKAPRAVQERQYPDEPEKVFKKDDREDLPEGMVRPIRVVTRGPEEGENDMLDGRMTLDISFVIQYAIIDIFDYVANFGSTTAIEKQLRDIGEITIAEKASRETPASFIKDLPNINAELVSKTQARFEHAGVRIISARLISPDISHGVSTALADVPVALAKAKQAAALAEGEKIKRTKEGEGSAAAELAMLTAQAEGRKKMMDALQIPGETVIASEAVRGLSDKTDVIVVGAESGMRDIMGIVKGAQSALKTKEPSAEEGKS